MNATFTTITTTSKTTKLELLYVEFRDFHFNLPFNFFDFFFSKKKKKKNEL